MRKSNKSNREPIIIQSSNLAIEEAHPRRPRCAYFGEMLQMDTSIHLLFFTHRRTIFKYKKKKSPSVDRPLNPI